MLIYYSLYHFFVAINATNNIKVLNIINIIMVNITVIQKHSTSVIYKTNFVNMIVIRKIKQNKCGNIKVIIILQHGGSWMKLVSEKQTSLGLLTIM